MADSNQVQVAIKPESTIGVFAGGNLQPIPFSSESLTTQKNAVESNNIESSRNVLDSITTALIPQGQVAFDFLYGAYDDIIIALMASAFNTETNVTSASITVSVSGTTLVGTGSEFANVEVGQWLRITDSGTDYFVKVATKTDANNITVIGQALVDGARTLNIRGKMLRNGTTLKSLTVETQLTELASDNFFPFYGMIPDQFTLDIPSEQIVKAKCDFIGTSGVAPVNASIGSGFDAISTLQSMAGMSSYLGILYENDTVITTATPIETISLSVNANVRREAALNVTNMGFGEFKVEGQLNTYMKGGMPMVDKYYNSTASSFSHRLVDPAGNSIIISVLRLKYSNFKRDIGGKNQAVMGTFDWTGIKHPTYGATLQIDLIPVGTA